MILIFDFGHPKSQAVIILQTTKKKSIFDGVIGNYQSPGKSWGPSGPGEDDALWVIRDTTERCRSEGALLEVIILNYRYVCFLVDQNSVRLCFGKSETPVFEDCSYPDDHNQNAT